ncbi:hypothetical protein SYNPS1DRAFT_26429 [Syncephalis pseudoplumigaleata]|uniref:Ankyrin repeat-containing domain protein n=1 Tax=Syncephalis pseudoplumigaleata TaxID=1712513 RepID=A0A4P9Z877_9FUNG|nr:hypothetical protein SYNPS1DRAFT_26429 [Syncephalis pseudoplumigaleata]|eukprot:RKP27950.1 hypothetical protein SYNPS1DRAFT_26429 [Syncephalis pseudoplumigaleata]
MSATTVSVEAPTMPAAYPGMGGVAAAHAPGNITEGPAATAAYAEFAQSTAAIEQEETGCSMDAAAAAASETVPSELESPLSIEEMVSLKKAATSASSALSDPSPSPAKDQQQASQLDPHDVRMSQRKSLDTDETQRALRRNNMPRDPGSLAMPGMRSLPPTLRASSSFGSLRSRPSSSTSCSLAIDAENGGFLTYGEFLCADTRPRWHRRRLVELQMLDDALRESRRFREPSKHRLRSRQSREMLKIRSKDIIMRHRASTIERLNALMPKKKTKKRTKAAIFNEVRLALRDHNVPLTCTLIDLVSPMSLRQKHANEANAILLHALANRMEQVVLLMLERGIPSDINAPILKRDSSSNNNNNNSNNNSQGSNNAGKKTQEFQYPSYFLFAIATGMYNVLVHMIKRANLNQSWYGLTPLMLACSRRTYDDHRVVALLLDYGADPELGILLPQLTFMSRLDRQAFRVPQPWNDEDDGSGEHTLRRRRLAQWGRTSSSAATPRSTQRSDDRKERIMDTATNTKAEHYIFPFEIAAARGNQQSMQLILKRMDSKLIGTANYALLVQNDPSIVASLLRTNINRLQRDEFGSTALHLAAREGNVVLLAILLDAGIDANLPGENGWTPLHEALSQRHVDACQYLLSRGASTSAKNNDDETIRALGERCGLSDTLMAQCLNAPGSLAPQIKELEGLARQHYRHQLSSSSDTTLVSGADKRRADETGQPLAMDNGSRSTLTGGAAEASEPSRFRFQSVKPKRVFTLLSRSVVGRRRNDSTDG